MYEKHWAFKMKPFENTPDPAFFYYSPHHEEALLLMNYGITQAKGGIIITGDYGTGKTLMSHVLADVIDQTKHKIVSITNPRLNTLEMLQEIGRQLSGQPGVPANKGELLSLIKDTLHRSYSLKIAPIIVIDEAQAIDDLTVFDELRMLLNLQLKDQFLVMLVFLGQPELMEKVHKIPQLKQRLGLRYHLTPLTDVETKAYILHRLNVARPDDNVSGIFTEDACKLIHQYAHGLPRDINNICDMALLYGFDRQAPHISAEIVNEVSRKFIW